MLKTTTDQFQNIHDGKSRKIRLHQAAPNLTNRFLPNFAEQALRQPRSF